MAETGSRKWIIAITVIMCSLLELIDTSIVNVTTSQIMANLGATLAEVSWVISAYGIANVIVVPMAGWLALRLGRRNYYVGSVVLFTIASALCGQSTNIWELVAFRFLQGIGGGALLATSQAILVETFPKSQLGLANALFGMGVILGPTLGPTIGGLIVDNLSWEWVFYVNLPIGLIAAPLAFIYIKDSVSDDGKAKDNPIDVWGIVLLIVGIGSLQLVLEQGQEKDWFESPYIIAFTITAVIGLIAFIWRELTTEHPIVDLRILKNRTLAVGTLLSFILGFGLFASVFIYPLFVQRYLYFTATLTGLSLLPGALVSGFMMPFIGMALSKGLQPKVIIPIGFFMFFVFTLTIAQTITSTTGEPDFFWPLIFRGMGLGCLFVPLTTMALGNLEGKDIAQGSGMTSMMRQLGGSFSVAICSAYVDRFTAQHRNDLVAKVSGYDLLTQDRLDQLNRNFLSKGFSFNTATDMAYKSIDNTIDAQAHILSYIDIFLYLGLFFLACIPVVFLAKGLKKGAQVHMGE